MSSAGLKSYFLSSMLFFVASFGDDVNHLLWLENQTRCPSSELDWASWEGAVLEVVHLVETTSRLQTVHVVCTSGLVCPTSHLYRELRTPVNVWDLQLMDYWEIRDIDPRLVYAEDFDGILAFTGSVAWDLYIVVAPSDETLSNALWLKIGKYAIAYFFRAFKARYILAWPGSCGGADAVLESASLAGLHRAVAVQVPGAPSNVPVDIWGVQLFGEGRPCRDTRAKRLATWNEGFNGPTPSLFPMESNRKLFGCPVTVSVTFNPPLFLAVEDEVGGTYHLEGKLTGLAAALAQGMNSTFNYVPYQMKHWMASLAPNVSAGSAPDVVMDLPLMVDISSQNGVFPMSSRVVTLAFCVPRVPRKALFWVKLSGEFQPIVWLLLFFAWSGTALLMSHLTNWEPGCASHAFYLFASMFGSAGRPVALVRARPLLFQWLLFIIIINVSYLAALRGMEMAPRFEESFRSSEDVKNSDLNITACSWDAFGLLQDIWEGRLAVENRIDRLDYEYFKAHELKREDLVLVCDEWYYAMLNAGLGLLEDGSPRYRRLEDLILATQPEVMFYTRWSSPFRHVVADVVLRLTESGIAGRLLDGVLDLPPDAGAAKSGLHRLEHAFVLFGVGLGLGVVCLLLELLWAGLSAKRAARWETHSWATRTHSMS